jgi:hypothetical protein
MITALLRKFEIGDIVTSQITTIVELEDYNDNSLNSFHFPFIPILPNIPMLTLATYGKDGCLRVLLLSNGKTGWISISCLRLYHDIT